MTVLTDRCMSMFDFAGEPADPILWCDLPARHDGEWHIEKHVGRWSLDHSTFQWWAWNSVDFLAGGGHWEIEPTHHTTERES